MKKERFAFLTLALLSTINPQLSTVFAQGSLTPPGAPAPTMKTLDQIASTGIAINDTNTPGDTNYHYIISVPGGYYLRSNLNVTKPNGIHVTVAGVTVDLNGFQISRSSGSGGDGITIDPTADRCVVKNGSLAGLGNAVRCAQSFPTIARGGAFLQLSVAGCLDQEILSAGKGWQIDGCKAHNNTGSPILAGDGSVISNCTVSDNQIVFNGVSAIGVGRGCTLVNCTACNNQIIYAISAGSGSTLRNCTASDNQADYGILVHNSTLANCSAFGNSGTGTSSGGIWASDGSTIIGCTSSGNQNTSATASRSTGIGILAGSSSTVKDCTTSNNKGDGIQSGNYCTITGCTSFGNGSGGIGDGVHTTGVNNRIDGNLALNNSGIGIHGSATSDYITRNTANTNTGGNYNPANGTYVGPFSMPGSATSPWANF